MSLSARGGGIRGIGTVAVWLGADLGGHNFLMRILQNHAYFLKFGEEENSGVVQDLLRGWLRREVAWNRGPEDQCHWLPHSQKTSWLFAKLCELPAVKNAIKNEFVFGFWTPDLTIEEFDRPSERPRCLDIVLEKDLKEFAGLSAKRNPVWGVEGLSDEELRNKSSSGLVAKNGKVSIEKLLCYQFQRAHPDSQPHLNRMLTTLRD